MKQKGEITFEHEQTVIVRQTSGHFIAFCPICNETVELLTPEIMTAITGTSEREIFRFIETGKIHFVETERVFCCPICFRNSVVDVTAKAANEK